MARVDPRLIESCRKLYRLYKLSNGSAGVFEERQRYHRIEITAHEVAHAFVLGLDPSEAGASDAVDSIHNRMPGTLWSDAEEIRACAVEYLVLRTFNVPISMRQLATTAAPMMRSALFCYHMPRIERAIQRSCRKSNVKWLAIQMREFLETYN
jgi:hypothetical protein